MEAEGTFLQLGSSNRRMIILEDDLEKLMVSNEPTELTFEGYQELSQRLNQLQPHMQASSGCWEETVSQVDQMLRRANAASGGFRVLFSAQPGLQTSGTPGRGCSFRRWDKNQSWS